MASCHIRARTLGDGRRRFDVRYRRGGRYVSVDHAGTFRTLGEARARKRLVDEWLASGLNPAVELKRAMGEGRTLGQHADDWLTSRRSVSENTRADYARHVDTIKHRFSGKPEDVTPADVRAWITKLSDSHKPATVIGKVRVLRMILDHADLAVNPARHRSVELPRIPRKTLEPPDAGDVVAVVAALPQRYRLPVVLMEQCGLRVSECLTLHVADVDTNRVLIRAEHSKTGRPRWVPCPPWLAQHATRGIPVLNRQVVYNGLVRACDQAGVKRFGPHKLRHRRGTLWHQQGVVAVELAARLGHAKPSMSLDVYAHIARLEEAPAHTLDALLR